MPWAIGHASQWAGWARSHGYAVNRTPAVGSVASWMGGNHVGWVEAVHSNGTVTTEESNWNSDGAYHRRTIGTAGLEFIHFKDIGGNPIGSFDLIARAPGGLRVAGWARDPDTTDPIAVHLYLDGAIPGSGSPIGGLAAALTRPDVGAHAFDGAVPYTTPGPHSVCIWAVNAGPGSATNLGCRPITISNDPFGSLDLVASAPGGVRVAGWAIDPDTAGPVSVHVYIDGGWAGAFTANGPRPDVAAAYPGYGANHAFDTVVAYAPRGTHTICTWAVNVGAGTPNGGYRFGCRTVTVT